jgi:AraC-like DNA-binding protein
MSTRRFRCQGLAQAYTALEQTLPGRKVRIVSSKDDICRYEIESSELAGLRVLSFKGTLPFALTATEEDDSLSFAVVERGANAVERRGVEIRTSAAGGCAIGFLRPGDVVKISAMSARRIVHIRPRQLNEVIARHFHVAPPSAIEFPVVNIIGAPRDALGFLMRRALLELETAAGPFGQIVAKQYSDLLVSSLLLLIPNSFSDVLGKSGGVATSRYVKRALDYMRANVDEPIDIDDIARSAACSPRRLQLAFRAEFGLTPMAFLKEERLKAAARRLRMGECDDVTSLAHSLGFSNPGRSAGLFRQKFGVLPSEILCSQPSPPTGAESAREQQEFTPDRTRNFEAAAAKR